MSKKTKSTKKSTGSKAPLKNKELSVLKTEPVVEPAVVEAMVAQISTKEEAKEEPTEVTKAPSTALAIEGVKDVLQEARAADSVEDTPTIDGKPDNTLETEPDSSFQGEPIPSKTLFGVNVSEIGTDYTTSNHRVAISFRNYVEELERMMFHVGDSSVKEIAENIQAGVNRLAERMLNHRKASYKKTK